MSLPPNVLNTQHRTRASPKGSTLSFPINVLHNRWMESRSPAEVTVAPKQEISNKDHYQRYFTVIFWEERSKKAAGIAVIT